MINQFRKLSPINLLLLLAYTFFMRMAIFYEMPPQLNFDFLEPFARLLINIDLDNAFSPGANIFFATILVFVQALIFNKVVNNHNLLSKPSFLPGLMFITGTSLFMPFMTLSPALIANFFLIWIIDKFLKLGKSANSITTVFDIGMIIALGTLIYFPFMAMILMIFLALLLFRPFSWREWLAGLIGFMTVFFFLAVFYYWNDNLTSFYQIWKPLGNKFPSVFKINYNDYLVLIPVVIIIILASLQLRENFFRSFISTRKGFQLLFFMFVVAGASLYLKPSFRIWHFLLCVPPGAVLLAYYFSNAKKRWFYETLFFLFVLSVQYFLFV
ncbi:beta-carotene 15,15'-monooxygenase [Pedobacter endophyticus]|uniref:Beta-carotene 15,15'-monooxygenase n=2 Tax=Pedobacter endophyticus TaxID=2789740 RepID=A0A7U3SNX4_9SPHI|nr:beta-carotene 15,15'-monooxygenase [Pedobacter endophyticus]